MHHSVCTISPARATLARFLTPPPAAPSRCACGEPLTLEMEVDAGRCVDCLFRTRILGGVS
jgi:hypothetical protein